MLTGHSTLTRLLSKRRKLSLSALSPHKRVLKVAKKEVEEDLLSVAAFVYVKDEGVEIRHAASIDEQTSREADALVGLLQVPRFLTSSSGRVRNGCLCKLITESQLREEHRWL